MEKIVGIQYITSKKNGLHYMKISTLDGQVYNIPGEREGQSTGEYFICEEDIKNGKIEVIGGDIKVGALVRIMKETIDGMDRVAMIMIYNGEPTEHFGKADNAAQERKTTSLKK